MLEALNQPIQHFRELFGASVRETSLAEICGGPEEEGLKAWCDTYNVLQWAEIESSLGAWIDSVKPAMGPITAASFDLVRNLDRRGVVRKCSTQGGILSSIAILFRTQRPALHTHGAHSGASERQHD